MLHTRASRPRRPLSLTPRRFPSTARRTIDNSDDPNPFKRLTYVPLSADDRGRTVLTGEITALLGGVGTLGAAGQWCWIRDAHPAARALGFYIWLVAVTHRSDQMR